MQIGARSGFGPPSGTNRGCGAIARFGGRRERAWKAGGYTEVAFDHGRVAIHEAESTSVGLSFQVDGDLGSLCDRLARASIEAPIIDETFGRSLRIPDPDGTDAEIWVNAVPTDHYGYTRT